MMTPDEAADFLIQRRQARNQRPAWAEFLFEPCRYKVMWGGRGGGKSRSVANALLVKAHAKCLRILCAREIQDSIRDSVKRLLDDEIARCGLGYFFVSTDTEIRGKNGSLFIFSGLRGNATRVKSMEGVDICWVEEAQTISKDSLDTLTPTIRGEDSEIWFTYNPNFPTDPVDAMFRGDEVPPDTRVVEVQYTDNPWFPDVLRAQMEYDRRRDPEKYNHIWLGRYRTNSEARVFKNWSIESFSSDIGDGRYYFGADWGFSVDPSVLVRSYIKGRSLYVDHEAYAVGCEIDYTPGLFAGSDTREPPRWKNPKAYPGVPGAMKWPIIADSARPETISYMTKRGFNVRAAKKGAGSVEDGIEFLQSYDIVVHPRCVHTIDELTMYSWKVDKLTKEVLPILVDKKNHVIDALRYSAEAARGVNYDLRGAL